jgi:plasmid replication initiation protein
MATKRSNAIEAQARPGETYAEAEARLIAAGTLTKPRKATLRKPPKDDRQMDCFVASLHDIASKDERSIMDVAVFRLSKKEDRSEGMIRYELADGIITVSAGRFGMASVWDYDLVLMGVSYLTEAMNRYRKGQGEIPSRVFKPHIADVLKFCRRSDGGNASRDLIQALTRLNTTFVRIDRLRTTRTGRVKTIAEGENLISNFRVISSKEGTPESLEIEMPKWIYGEIVLGEKPDVLTIHRDFFLIEPGIGRFLYRLARKAAGHGEAAWTFELIHQRSGSTNELKKFTYALRKLIEGNALPEYDLREEQGRSGPVLVMTYRHPRITQKG